CATDGAASSEGTASKDNTQSKDTESTASTANGADKAYKIGIASREITNDFNRDIVTNAQASIEAAGGTVVTTDAQADFQKHNENIENLINSGIDGLIVQLGDAQQLAPIMAKAKAKGIPVVTCAVGAPVPDTLTDINGDNPLMSVLAADALLSSINYQGDVYIVWVPGAPLLETRKRIFEAIAADFPAVTLHEVPTEHNPAKVQTQIEEILTANPDKGSIAGIYGTYDLLVSGASEAIRRAGRGDEIKVVGTDGDRIAFQMMFQEDSPFCATVVQDVPSIGKQAADILLGILDGTIDPATVSPQTSANCYVATRKNGVAAAELRWTDSFWEDTGLVKADVEKVFPQIEDVLVTFPSIP
ncbi:MAG: substrate-binding domain-containing protein, partial [Acetanaerobacterium sp.]